MRDGKSVLDEESVPFGIREYHFDPATGFWLNGSNFKIKGVCLHGDAGGLGVAVPLAAWERRLATLRTLGVNAIRTAHNPPAPEFLDLCDRMGFLVMDEMFDCWTVAKNPYDYHLYFREWSQTDTRDTVMRDRNHPASFCIARATRFTTRRRPTLAKDILERPGRACSTRNDPTRPVTQALFRPNVSHDYDDGLADLLDVVGQNYRENEILAAHARKAHAQNHRHGESDGPRRVAGAARSTRPYAGQFLWAGIDYLGEARAVAVDRLLAGAARSHRRHQANGGYERQSWWAEKPMVHIVRRVAPAAGARRPIRATKAAQRRQVQTLFADWTPSNLAAHEENVEVYSNCDEVELSLNGKSLGAKTAARGCLAADMARGLRTGRNCRGLQECAARRVAHGGQGIQDRAYSGSAEAAQRLG